MAIIMGIEGAVLYIQGEDPAFTIREQVWPHRGGGGGFLHSVEQQQQVHSTMMLIRSCSVQLSSV